MIEKIKEAIDAIRPNLQAHGGDIEFIGLTADNVVQVSLRGACAGCPGAARTLQMGVEQTIREYAPGIKGVENIR